MPHLQCLTARALQGSLRVAQVAVTASQRQPSGSAWPAPCAHSVAITSRTIQAGQWGSRRSRWAWGRLQGSCKSFSSTAGSSGPQERDPYKVLGVDRNASDDEIKAAYRKQALKWHPDRHPPEKRKEAEQRFSAAANAYEILSDHEKRRQYDMLGGRPSGPGGPSGFPGGGGGFHWGSSVHSQEAAEHLFRQTFGGQGLEELLSQFFGQPPLNALKAGMDVQVLSDPTAVLRACRECGIDSTNDGLRVRALGKKGRIVKADPKDQSVKVRIESIGEVWLGARAVRLHGSSASGGPMGIFGGLGGLGGGAGGRVMQVKQEQVVLPNGRRVVRITRIVQQPDGSVHQDISELPVS